MAEEFTRYERARILGARALQLAMDAPVLMKMEDDALGNLNFDPLRIAEIELDAGALPISVNRPMPERKKDKIESVKVEDNVSDEKKIKDEEVEEKEMAEEGAEIMALANPEEESENVSEDIASEVE